MKSKNKLHTGLAVKAEKLCSTLWYYVAFLQYSSSFNNCIVKNPRCDAGWGFLWSFMWELTGWRTSEQTRAANLKGKNVPPVVSYSEHITWLIACRCLSVISLKSLVVFGHRTTSCKSMSRGRLYDNTEFTRCWYQGSQGSVLICQIFNSLRKPKPFSFGYFICKWFLYCFSVRSPIPTWNYQDYGCLFICWH